MAYGPITSWQIEGEKVEIVTDFLFSGSTVTEGSDWGHKFKRRFATWKESYAKLSVLKSRGITLLTKVCVVKAMFFSSSHVWMWELGNKEGWAPKNWCFRTVVLENTLESPLGSKEIKPVNSKGNQPWIFIGRTDAEAVILWPPDAKSWLFGKDPDAGKNWRQEEKRMAENDMVR